MRVISGSARGRRLKELQGMDTRPTTDKVKESLFNIIQFEIEGRSVLDLFGGTGQLGIEALSRGAERCTFVDARREAAALIRENLTKAMDYQLRWERAQASQEEDEPEFDPRLDALRPVMAGKLPAHFHAHRADDMVTAVRLAREFGLECVLVHGTEGHRVADWLAREGVPVITGPSLTHRSKPELANLTMENTAILARAGVQVAICTDHPEIPIQHLPLCAALAARAGMDEEEALAAITINAACMAGLDDRLGSLTIGKDADVVVMSGHPFDVKSRVQYVWIDGQEVPL